MAYALLRSPAGLGLDVKAAAADVCKQYADNDMAARMCGCAKDLKADREHIKQCAAAAASATAGAYCAAQTGSAAVAAICSDVAGYIAGPVAGAVYDAGDALVTGFNDLFGSDETVCGCATCYWGKCWSNLTEAQRVRFCTMPEHVHDWPRTAALVQAQMTCPDVLRREVATRLDAVTRVNAGYLLWVKSMVKALNDKLLPQLLQLGKPNVPFTPAYVEALLARHAVSPQQAGFETAAPQPAWWFQKIPATKPTGYGWFRGTSWDSPINIAGISADQYAVSRALLWSQMLVSVQPRVLADILQQIAQAVQSVDRKHLQDFTAARRSAHETSAKGAALLLLTGAALAGIVIWRRRKK